MYVYRHTEMGVYRQCKENVTEQACEFAGAPENAPGRQKGAAHTRPYTFYCLPLHPQLQAGLLIFTQSLFSPLHSLVSG